MRESVWQSLKRGGLHLALVAMMLRALLPAGWMPFGEIGQPLVVCTAASAIEHQQSPKKDPATSKDHGVCPFAALTSATPPDQFAALPAPSQFGVVDVAASEQQTSLSKPRFVASAPRAPPVLA